VLLPYECYCLQRKGQNFSVAYFGIQSTFTYKTKTSRIDDDESDGKYFKKTKGISRLDIYLRDYLGQFGISMDIEREPLKKNV